MSRATKYEPNPDIIVYKSIKPHHFRAVAQTVQGEILMRATCCIHNVHRNRHGQICMDALEDWEIDRLRNDAKPDALLVSVRPTADPAR